MSRDIEVRIDSLDGTSRTETFEVRRMYNLGSATRDPNTAVAHQQEVALSGIHIAFDVPAPRIYPIALDAPGPADSSVRLGNARGVLPYSALVGADGRLLATHVGDFDAAELEAFVAALPGRR